MFAGWDIPVRDGDMATIVTGFMITGLTVRGSTISYRLSEPARVTIKLQQKRGGHWVTIGRRQPAVVERRGLLTVRAQLKSPDGTEWLTEQVRVPTKARGEGRLSMTGGSWTWNEDLWEANTLEEVQEAMAGDVRNDEVETRLSFWSRRTDLTKRAVSEPQQLVVEGNRSASVVVRR